MIRQYNNTLVSVNNGEVVNVAEIFCNSTDTKPTSGLANGSKLTEVDTGKTYLFDEVNAEWNEYSGGGGASEPLIVDFTTTDPNLASWTVTTPNITKQMLVDRLTTNPLGVVFRLNVSQSVITQSIILYPSMYVALNGEYEHIIWSATMYYSGSVTYGAVGDTYFDEDDVLTGIDMNMYPLASAQ